jgi:hypothetical protein
VLIFQFGSNTSSERLNSADRLAGDANDLGLCRTVHDFDLDFDVWSNSNQCAAADLRPSRGRSIFGVLYDIPDYLVSASTAGARKSLDKIEGPRYERRKILIQRPDGTPIPGPVFTYLVKEPAPNLKTSRDYVSHILHGLRDHNAPDEYLEYVKRRISQNNPSLPIAEL